MILILTARGYMFTIQLPGRPDRQADGPRGTELLRAYSNLPTWGGAEGYFLANPASHVSFPPITLSGPGPADSGSGLAPAPSGTHHGFYTAPGTAITIADDSGQSIGFADSVTFNTMADAVPMIPLDTEYSHLIGFLVPAGEYGGS